MTDDAGGTHTIRGISKPTLLGTRTAASKPGLNPQPVEYEVQSVFLDGIDIVAPQTPLLRPAQNPRLRIPVALPEPPAAPSSEGNLSFVVAASIVAILGGFIGARQRRPHKAAERHNATPSQDAPLSTGSLIGSQPGSMNNSAQATPTSTGRNRAEAGALIDLEVAGATPEHGLRRAREEVNLLSIHRIIQGIARRWWLLLTLAAMGGVAGYLGSYQVQPVYEATTSILVGQLFEDPNLTKDTVEAAQTITRTYADVGRRQPILQDVVNELNLQTSWPALREHVRVQLPPSNPQLIAISVEADSPESATSIADEITTSLVDLSPTDSEVAAAASVDGFVRERLGTLQQDIIRGQGTLNSLENSLAGAQDLETREDLRGRIEAQQRLIIDWQNNYSSLLGVLAAEESPNSLQVLESATSSGIPIRPDIPLNTVLAAGAGLLLAIGLAYAFEFRSSRNQGSAESPLRANSDADPPSREEGSIRGTATLLRD